MEVLLLLRQGVDKLLSRISLPPPLLLSGVHAESATWSVALLGCLRSSPTCLLQRLLLFHRQGMVLQGQLM